MSLLRNHLKAVRDNRGGGLYALDLETDGLFGKITLAAAASHEGEVVSPNIEWVLRQAHSPVVGQNFKYDLRCLIEQGFPVTFDGMILELKAAAQMINENRPLDLKSLGVQDLGKPDDVTEEDWTQWQRGWSGQETPEELERYARVDVLVTRRLMFLYGKKLKSLGMWDEFLRIECPMTLLAAEMEIRGFRIDTAMLDNMLIDTSKEILTLRGMLRGLVPEGPWGCKRDGCVEGIYTPKRGQPRPCTKCEGTGQNLKVWGSPLDIPHILFDMLGLKPTLWTDKGNVSTSEDALTLMLEQVEPKSKESEFVKNLLIYRGLSKLHSGFLVPYKKLDTDIIHAQGNPQGTRTGRWSYSKPNLQQCPKETIRPLFIAREGMTLVGIDFVQAEMYVAAKKFGEPQIVEAYEDGIDLHARTAAVALGIKVSEVTQQQRDEVGKRVNFSLLYGLQPPSLSVRLGVSLDKAKRIIDRVMGGYEGLYRGIEATKRSVRNNGYIRSTPSRFRRLPWVNSREFKTRMKAENQGVNALIQGEVAYRIKRAMIAARLRVPEARPILQIHDEVVFEVEKARADQTAVDLVEIFEEPTEGYGLRAEAKVGERWS